MWNTTLTSIVWSVILCLIELTDGTTSETDVCLSYLKDVCLERASCDGGCGQAIQNPAIAPRSCSCDHLCPIYNDCCFDFYTQCPNEARKFNGIGLMKSDVTQVECLNSYLAITSCSHKTEVESRGKNVVKERKNVTSKPSPGADLQIESGRLLEISGRRNKSNGLSNEFEEYNEDVHASHNLTSVQRGQNIDGIDSHLSDLDSKYGQQNDDKENPEHLTLLQEHSSYSNKEIDKDAIDDTTTLIHNLFLVTDLTYGLTYINENTYNHCNQEPSTRMIRPIHKWSKRYNPITTPSLKDLNTLLTNDSYLLSTLKHSGDVPPTTIRPRNCHPTMQLTCGGQCDTYNDVYLRNFSKVCDTLFHEESKLFETVKEESIYDNWDRPSTVSIITPSTPSSTSVSTTVGMSGCSVNPDSSIPHFGTGFSALIAFDGPNKVMTLTSDILPETNEGSEQSNDHYCERKLSYDRCRVKIECTTHVLYFRNRCINPNAILVSVISEKKDSDHQNAIAHLFNQVIATNNEFSFEKLDFLYESKPIESGARRSKYNTYITYPTLYASVKDDALGGYTSIIADKMADIFNLLDIEHIWSGSIIVCYNMNDTVESLRAMTKTIDLKQEKYPCEEIMPFASMNEIEVTEPGHSFNSVDGVNFGNVNGGNFGNLNGGNFGNENGGNFGNENGGPFGNVNGGNFGNANGGNFANENGGPFGNVNGGNFGNANGGNFGNENGGPFGNANGGNFGNENGGPFGNVNGGNFGNENVGNVGNENGGPFGNVNGGNFDNENGGPFGNVNGSNFGNENGGNFGNVNGGNFGNANGMNFGNLNGSNLGNLNDSNFGHVNGSNFGNFSLLSKPDNKDTELYSSGQDKEKTALILPILSMMTMMLMMIIMF